MSQKTGSNIGEELKRFREIKKNQGLLEINLKRRGSSELRSNRQTFNPEESFQGTYTSKNEQKSPIFVANYSQSACLTTQGGNQTLTTPTPRNEQHYDQQPPNQTQFFNPVLNKLLSPSTASRLELVKRMDHDSQEDRLMSDGALFTDEDKENTQALANATNIVQHDAIPPFFPFNASKSNHRYVSLDNLSLSRNTLFTTDKSCDLVEFRNQQLNNQQKEPKAQVNLNNRINLEGSFIGLDDTQDFTNPQDQNILQITLGTNTAPGLKQLCQNTVAQTDGIQQRRNSTSQPPPELDTEIISFYQKIKTHQEKQIKSQKTSIKELSFVSQNVNTSQQIQSTSQSILKPPKNNYNLTIKVDQLNDSLLKHHLIPGGISQSQSCRNRSHSERVLTPVNMTPTAQSMSTMKFYESQGAQAFSQIPVKKMNLFEVEQLRQQIDILIKERHQKDIEIASLTDEVNGLRRSLKIFAEKSSRQINMFKQQIESQDSLKLEIENLLFMNERLREQNTQLLSQQQQQQSHYYQTNPSFKDDNSNNIQRQSFACDSYQFNPVSNHVQQSQQVSQMNMTYEQDDEPFLDNSVLDCSKIDHTASNKQIVIYPRFDTSSGRCYNTSRSTFVASKDSKNVSDTFRRSVQWNPSPQSQFPTEQTRRISEFNFAMMNNPGESIQSRSSIPIKTPQTMSARASSSAQTNSNHYQ